MNRTVFSGVPAFDRADAALKAYETLYESEVVPSDYFHEYLELSILIQSLFISDNGYVIDTGNFQTANYAILRRIVTNVKKHPKLWKKFMVV